jgi:hypothetical protein
MNFEIDAQRRSSAIEEVERNGAREDLRIENILKSWTRV